MFSIISLLIFGLILLVKGADWLVDGAVLIAKRFRVSPLVIGLTIVAFGTSTPELVVNIIASLDPGTSDIGLGNIIGSNISNIGLIIGASALIAPLLIKPKTIAKEVPLMILSAIVFLVLAADGKLGTTEGVILLFFFVLFLYYMTTAIAEERATAPLATEFAKEYKDGEDVRLTPVILMTLGGLAAVIWGGDLVVDNAVKLAQLLGLSQIFIGLTIIAVGTSLPELATGIVAAVKRESDIVVGNIVGSNIFNTFLILGVNAVISPIRFQTTWFWDTAIMIIMSILLLLVIMVDGDQRIKRREGSLLLIVYILYIAFVIIRG